MGMVSCGSRIIGTLLASYITATNSKYSFDSDMKIMT